MLQHDQPSDYVVATGESHSVRDFVEIAFAHASLDWREYVREDHAFLRPAEVEHLVGDASRVRQVLGWKPTVSFPELVNMMVDSDLSTVRDSGPKN